MRKNRPIKYEKSNNCEILIEGAEDSLKRLGNCFESAFDEKQTKMNVVGNIFGLGASLTKLALNTTGCAIKNAPKAVVAVASVKREIVNAIEEEVRETQKQHKEDALEEKIKQLKLKK